MGLNTIVLILNDQLGYIEDDHNFGNDLVRAITTRGCLVEHSDPRFRVISIAHADDTQIVATHGNLGANVSYALPPKTRKLIREAMDAALKGDAK